MEKSTELHIVANLNRPSPAGRLGEAASSFLMEASKVIDWLRKPRS